MKTPSFLKKFMKTEVSPSGRSIRPISFIFFLNERYLDTNMSSIIEIYSTPTLLKLYSNAILPCTFLMGHIHSSNSNSHSSSSNEWILIVLLSEHSVDQALSFELLTA